MYLDTTKIGETSYNNNGSKMTIIKYIDSKDVVIKFENGFITRNTYSNFKLGNIKFPYYRSVYNVGYMGEGKYKSTLNGLHTKKYDVWLNMIHRCYNKDKKERYKPYEGCSVCDEWHNFQTFAKWYDENYYKVDKERMELDKDILIKGNKVYSPKTCIIVPQYINSLFTKREAQRGEYPIGVSAYNGNKIKNVQCLVMTKIIK